MRKAPDRKSLSFDFGSPPHNNTACSVAAARSQRDTVKSKRALVYSYIAQRGQTGATSDEVERALGLRHTTVSARINEMSQREKPSLLRDSGQRRLTSGKRMATVWVVAQWTT